MAASLRTLRTCKSVCHLYKEAFGSRFNGLICGAKALHTSSIKQGAHDAEFSKAKERLNSLTEDPGNLTKLQIYALFKQATIGKCNVKKPGMMDFVGKAKWDAWNGLGDLSQDEAQLQYIAVVNELAGNEPDAAQGETSASESKYQELKVLEEDGMTKIILNRPAKKNAINYQMYDELQLALNEAANNKSAFAVITGAGDYYCSGNDLSNFMSVTPETIAEHAKNGGDILRKFVGAFIDFPKPLVGVINGPAVGVSVTLLGLFDIVYATESATFHTPFSLLGQSAEGCSSLIFPKIMGHAKAMEVLIFNRKLTAQEAYDRNLVTEVFPDSVFQKQVWDRLKECAAFPPNSMTKSKVLVRNVEREALHKANDRECTLLEELWQGPECANAVMAFFQKKN